MLDQPAEKYGEEVIPAPEIGKRIVNTPFGQIKVDWPEDPRISNHGIAAGYGEGILALNEQLKEQKSQKDVAWGKGMFPKQSGFGGFGPERYPTPTVVPTGGNTGGGNTGGGNTGGGADDDSVDPPRPPKETKTRIPGTSSEFLSMPDLSKAIDDEIKRLTLSIIEDGKDLILSKTVNYKSIDFIPEVEVQINPPQKRINFIRDQFNDIARAVQRNINKSKKAYTNVYNYGEYLDFFEVRYNRSDGRPVVTFKINLEDFNLSELSVVNLRRTG